jgi:hypothetical protein
VTEPSQPIHPDETVDDERSDEDRDISDVGLPHPGDDAGTVPAADDAALDEVFPPEDR